VGVRATYFLVIFFFFFQQMETKELVLVEDYFIAIQQEVNNPAWVI
jgi:hypothetical protein